MHMHWWTPGVAPCGAGFPGQFTGEPDRVTCPACLAYIDQRCAAAGRTPADIGDAVRKVLNG